METKGLWQVEVVSDQRHCLSMLYDAAILQATLSCAPKRHAPSRMFSPQIRALACVSLCHGEHKRGRPLYEVCLPRDRDTVVVFNFLLSQSAKY